MRFYCDKHSEVGCFLFFMRYTLIIQTIDLIENFFLAVRGSEWRKERSDSWGVCVFYFFRNRLDGLKRALRQ